MRHWTIPVLLCGLLAAPCLVVAQVPAIGAVDALVPRPAALLLDMPGGAKPREYQADEIAIAVSRTMDGRGDTRGDVTISFGAMRPLDTALLQWARQGELSPDASRRVIVTVPASPGPPATEEVRYELEAAKVVGFSASHSAGTAMMQLMLQVSARRVTLNGIVMN